MTGATCLAAMLYYTRGRWLAPLDDAYIVLAYGRELLQGHPYRFNPGDPASSGSTSILYTILAAPFAAFGRNEVVPVIGLTVLNGALFWWTCRMAWSLAAAMMPGWLARLAVLAVIANGPVVFGVFCGLDTSLMMALTLLLWYSWDGLLRSRNAAAFKLPATAAVLLALTRPEGAVLALAVGLAAGFWLFRSRLPRAAAISVAIGVGALFSTLLPSLLVTGSILPSSGWAKIAWFSHVTPLSSALSDSLAFIVASFKGVWMGLFPAEAVIGQAGGAHGENEAVYYFPPGAFGIAALGLLPLAGRLGTPVLGGVIWLIGWLLISAILPVGWHHHRYLAPLFPPFILLSFAGIARLGDMLQDPWKRQVPRLLAAIWLAFAIPGFFRHIQLFGFGSSNYFWHHRVMAERLEEIPGSDAVAASDVGILKYFTRRNVIDLKALTCPWLAPAASRGWGSIYDVFKRKPPAERPAWAALHSGRPDVDAELVCRAGVFRPVLTLSHPRVASDFVLYKCDWGGPGKPPSIPGWKIVDELDCGDPESEKVHAYRMHMAGPDGFPYSTIQVRRDSATREEVGDGGWVLGAGEDFAIFAEAGRPLVLEFRTFAPVPAYLTVSFNGDRVSEVPVSRAVERFQTIVAAQIPGDLVLARNEISVRCRRPESQHYSSFHYWAFQPGSGK